MKYFLASLLLMASVSTFAKCHDVTMPDGPTITICTPDTPNPPPPTIPPPPTPPSTPVTPPKKATSLPNSTKHDLMFCSTSAQNFHCRCCGKDDQGHCNKQCCDDIPTPPKSVASDL